MAYESENLMEKHQLREHERLRKLGFTVVVLDSKELSCILGKKLQ